MRTLSNEQVAKLRLALASTASVTPEVVNAWTERVKGHGFSEKDIEGGLDALRTLARSMDDAAFAKLLKDGQMKSGRESRLRIDADETGGLRAGGDAIGCYGNSACTPQEPSIGGFIAYLVTGCINGFYYG